MSRRERILNEISTPRFAMKCLRIWSIMAPLLLIAVLVADWLPLYSKIMMVPLLTFVLWLDWIIWTDPPDYDAAGQVII